MSNNIMCFFIKLILFSYLTYLIVMITVSAPIGFLFYGLYGLKEAFIDEKSLSYSTYKQQKGEIRC